MPKSESILFEKPLTDLAVIYSVAKCIKRILINR